MLPQPSGPLRLAVGGLTSITDDFAFFTYNLCDYRRTGRSDEARYARVEEVIRELVRPGTPTVGAVQELPGDDWTSAAHGLGHLASATGLHCQAFTDGTRSAAAVPGGHDCLGLGLLWSAEVDPIADTLRYISGGPLWHALVMVDLNVGGHRISAASYHAPPKAGRDRRTAEAGLVATTLRSHAGDGGEIWLGADWNSPSSRTTDGLYYDPDPTEMVTSADRQRWGDDLPEIGYRTDRTPDMIMADAGFRDAAVEYGAPWAPTTGHGPNDRNGPRRIDRILYRPAAAAPGGVA
ncbi:hypothetical protein AB0J86_00790 [Micromonospora sp. NPDC049559]|uniref:hypothetical protein n=1 Tax=Micromonospora sp. NPDC049559 TaxID=3155923 RepID=UPI003438B22B